MFDHFASADSILIAEDSLEHERYCREMMDDELSRVKRKIDPKDRIDINIGLDLGTSNTKLVWRYREKSYPVCFGSDPDSITSYLYPSVVYFDGISLQTGFDANCDDNWRVQFNITNFKVCIACNNNPNSKCKIEWCTLTKWNLDLFQREIRGSEVSFITTYYLASVLSRARRLILTAFEERYGLVNSDNIRWSINLAVPNRYMKYPNITGEYKLALKAGWLMSRPLSRLMKKSSARLMMSCYLYSKQLASNQEMDCFVIPETVAQVTSFIRSKNTSDGLYALIDIGAGTVDVSVFRIYSPYNEPRQLADYATSVLNTGSAFIESLAFYWFSPRDWYPESGKIESDVSKQSAENKLRNALRLIKENNEHNQPDYTIIQTSDLRQSLEVSSGRIKCRVHDLLKKVFKEAYRYETNINTWKELRIIFGGGGARSPHYKEASVEAFSIDYEGRKLQPSVIDFNRLDDFLAGGLGHKHLDRFAVAYGLSLSEIELLKYFSDETIQPLRPHQQTDRFLPPGYY